MSLTEEQLNHFKQRLEGERASLEEDLRHVGRKNPRVSGDWEVKDPSEGADVGDEADAAEAERAFANTAAIEENLEAELERVRAALQRIKDGTYGRCTNCGGEREIPLERLEAYPAADTCVHCGE